MDPFDLAWFQAMPYGAPFTLLTAAQYEHAYTLSAFELKNVACWCAEIYPQALSMKIAIVLDQAGFGRVPPETANPVVDSAGGNYEAYVVEDEVYDVRRKYQIKEKAKQLAASSPTGLLESLIAGCKPPLGVGATLGGRLGGAFSKCCGGRDSRFDIADKAEWNHGGQ